MTLPTLRAAAACLALAAVLGATACAPSPEPAPTGAVTSEPTDTPTPTPTPAVLVVDPGDKPPSVFNGDCEAMLTAAQVSAIVGQVVVPEGLEEPHRPVTTLGALACGWRGSSLSLRLSTFPATPLEGAPLMPDPGIRHYFTDACDWYCGWLSKGSEFIVMGHINDDASPIERERADELGAELAAVVRSNAAANPRIEWAPDRSGWWIPDECAPLSAETSLRLGSEVEIMESGYIDTPAVWLAVADSVTHSSICADPTRGAFGFTVEPGGAWAVTEPGMMPVDIAVAGWTASRPLSTERGDYLLATDGVNLLSLWVYETQFAREELAAAVIHALVLQQDSATTEDEG